MSPTLWVSCLCLFAPALQESAREDGGAPAEAFDVSQLDDDLHWRTGEISLDGGLAVLALPDGYRYLEPREAKVVLEDFWGNPPGELTLGMIFPADKGPLDEDGWGVVLRYSPDGYVSDEDAHEIDYAELLADMQSATREENEMLSEAGYGTLQLIGWAKPPRYDAEQHELFWAKELRFEDMPENTLNYDVRVLGRRGVLSMNAVAAMSQLDEVEESMASLLGSVAFSAGNRYEEFDSSVDEVAAYGLGGLIAGKLALKAGLFKGLLAALVAAKKLVVVAVIAVGAFLSKLFKSRKSAEATGQS